MALLTISEYPGGPPLGTQAPQHPPITRQSLVVGGGSVPSQAFNEATKMIRVNTDTKCAFRIEAPGVTPTALITDDGMTAGQTEFMLVYPGAKIAVIAT
jgi:hypothetical protein